MASFLDWFNGNEPADLVLKAGVAHLWFVTIHPFDDGNGRIARAIADLLLARSERTSQRFYSMSARIRDERNAYYDILEATQKNGLDVSPWLEWFLGCLDRAFDGAEGILATVLRKAKFWEAHGDDQFNPRQQLMLNRLLDGFEGKLTTSKWVKIAKCSQDTALRDIDDLVARRVMVRDASGGRSTSYSLIANLGDAIRAVAAYTRAKAGIFVRHGARMLTPDETDERRKQIEALANKLDALATESECRTARYDEFESVLRDLHRAGFWPTDDLVSATAFAFHRLS